MMANSEIEGLRSTDTQAGGKIVLLYLTYSSDSNFVAHSFLMERFLIKLKALLLLRRDRVRWRGLVSSEANQFCFCGDAEGEVAWHGMAWHGMARHSSVFSAKCRCQARADPEATHSRSNNPVVPRPLRTKDKRGACLLTAPLGARQSAATFFMA